MKFNDNYDEHKDEFFDMLSKFKDKWDGHLGQINSVKHGIKLTSPDVPPMH